MSFARLKCGLHAFGGYPAAYSSTRLACCRSEVVFSRRNWRTALTAGRTDAHSDRRQPGWGLPEELFDGCHRWSHRTQTLIAVNQGGVAAGVGSSRQPGLGRPIGEGFSPGEAFP